MDRGPTGEETTRDLVGDVVYEASRRMSARYGVTVVRRYRRSWRTVTLELGVPELGFTQAVQRRSWWRDTGWEAVCPVGTAAAAVGAAIRAHAG